ncbi:MAG: hypothetical protein ACRDKI_03100 [Solirubrobacterales bacterium]
MPQNHGDKPGDPADMNPRQIDINYVVDPEAVAEALIRRVNALADERAKARRALIRSVEVLVPGDSDGPAITA